MNGGTRIPQEVRPAWGGAVALGSMIVVGMIASWRWLLTQEVRS